MKELYFFLSQSPNPPPHLLFYDSQPKLIFQRPKHHEITFSEPVVTTTVCHVFLDSFKQNSTYSLPENSFHQKALSYINQCLIIHTLQLDRVTVFYMIIENLKKNEIYYSNYFWRNNVKRKGIFVNEKLNTKLKVTTKEIVWRRNSWYLI